MNILKPSTIRKTSIVIAIVSSLFLFGNTPDATFQVAIAYTLNILVILIGIPNVVKNNERKYSIVSMVISLIPILFATLVLIPFCPGCAQ